MVAVPGALTDPSRVHSEDVTVASGGDALRAHLARPAAGTVMRAGIIVLHEAWGVNDHIRDVTRRIANLGYDALAPELYSREGPPHAADPASVRDKMLALPDDRVLGDLAACAAHLRALDSASGKVGCIGFCAGGRYTLLFAATAGDALDAAVDCWGGNVDRANPDEETNAQRPRRVVDLLDGVRCPVYLVGGAEDANPSPQVLEDVRARLAAAGIDVRLDIFENAGHAFLADYRPTYREEPAHALWPRIVEFFERTLS